MDDRTQTEYELGTGSSLSELRIEDREPMEDERAEWWKGSTEEREDIDA